MNLQSLCMIATLVATMLVLAAPTCNPPEIVRKKIAHSRWPWLRTDRLITIYVPPNVSSPVDIEVTGLHSGLG